MIGLKTPIFSPYVIGLFNKPITFKVVVWIKQSHSKLWFTFRATFNNLRLPYTSFNVNVPIFITRLFYFSRKLVILWSVGYWTSCTKNASASTHRPQTIYWIFKQTKLSSIYRQKRIGPWWNIKRCLQLRRNSNLQLFLFLLFGRLRLWWNPHKRVARGGKLWFLKRCCIQIYSTSCLLCYEKAVNLQYMWNLEWSNV